MSERTGPNYPKCCCGHYDVSDMDFQSNNTIHTVNDGCMPLHVYEIRNLQCRIAALEAIVKAGDEMYLWSAKLNASVSEEDKAHCALELHRARFAYRKAKEVKG